MTTKKLAAAYVRVSSEEQTEGWSLEGQEKSIRDYAEQNDYEIVRVYHDETSGSREDRPGLTAMLGDARAGKFKAIIAIHTSRFARDVGLARRYKHELRERMGIEVLFVTQYFDPEDPTGFLVEGVNELFDEYYLLQLKLWTTLGKQTRAEKGLYNGTLPFGYTLDDDGVPIPHPDNAEGLVLAFKAYSTGRYSDVQIAELLNSKGYRTTGNWQSRPFTKDTITPLLQNEFYLGYVKYKGEPIPGKHEALIDQELFDKVQKVRKRRAGKSRSMGRTRRVYVLSGIARCKDCGLTLRCYATQSKGKWRYMRHTAKVRGYDCPVGTVSLRADELERQWGEIVGRIVLPLDWKRRVEDLAGDADERETILRERDIVQEKLRRLKRLYKDLIIEDDEYRSERDALQSRLAALVLPDNPQVIEAGEYLESLAVLWEKATLAEQRDITRVLLKPVFVDLETTQIVAIEPQPVFSMLFTDICEDLGVEIR